VASGKIAYDGISHWLYCKAVRLRGNRNYQAVTINEPYDDVDSPYSILVFGYRQLILFSSVYRHQPLTEMNKIFSDDQSANITLTNGVIHTGDDGNRQYIALIPNGVTLTQVT